MSPSFTIEALDRTHLRTDFACGVEALDRYFRETVTQDIKRRVSNCFVALDKSREIAAYYTFAASGIPLSELPADLGKRLPRYPLIPAGLIGRLAVDSRFQGQGLGASLILDAVNRAVRSDPAIYALIVDAKDDAASRFYQHFGFQVFASQPARLFLPIAAVARKLIKD